MQYVFVYLNVTLLGHCCQSMIAWRVKMTHWLVSTHLVILPHVCVCVCMYVCFRPYCANMSYVAL